jgi:alpha-L-arabinofuranosidase
MKKFMCILVALIGFGIGANADEIAAYCGGNHVGGITAWITPDGYLKVQNSSNYAFEVTIAYGGTRRITVKVPANTTNAEGYNCGKVTTANNNGSYTACEIKSATCK